jgi:putative inorganic carbon (HCO3(-)) transporter
VYTPRKYAQLRCICQGLEIRVVKQHLKTAAGRIADLELVIVALGIAPVLIFDAWMPRWIIGLALVLIPTLWLVRWFGRGYLTQPTPLDVPILLLLLMVVVGIWAAPIRMVALPEVYRIILGVALFYAMVNTLTTARYLQVVTALVLAATAALGVLALLGTDWSSGKFALPLLDAIYARLPAMVRPFWNPGGFGSNTMGGILAMLLPLLIAFAVGARRWLLKGAFAVAATAGCLALLLSQSRGGTIGLLLAILVMGVARSRWLLIVVLLVSMGGLLAIGTTGIDPISDLVSSVSVDSAASSLEGRVELWSRALYMSQDFPFTGVGLGMFSRTVQILYPLFLVSPDVEIPHPHNIFFSQVVDAGFPGLVAFLALLILLFFIALRSTRLSKQGEWWPLAIGLLGSLVAFVAHGHFDSTTSFIKAHTVIWGLIGLQTTLWLYLRGQTKRLGLGS